MRVALLAFLISTLDCAGQGFLKIDTLDQLPARLLKLAEGSFSGGFKVDFTGDGKQDFIITTRSNDSRRNEEHTEYWITSDMQVIKKARASEEEIIYFWFINLDRDVEPEILRASGYEDGIDYAIYDQNLATGKDSVVLYFNPVIDGRETLWAYPWNISGMIVKNEHGIILLKVSLDHDIIRDGVVTIPKPPAKFPAVFLQGRSTQPESKISGIRNVQWMSLEELR